MVIIVVCNILERVVVHPVRIVHATAIYNETLISTPFRIHPCSFAGLLCFQLCVWEGISLHVDVPPPPRLR